MPPIMKVVDAAKTANVDHFIRTMPDGYEMIINSEGDNVSLGAKTIVDHRSGSHL